MPLSVVTTTELVTGERMDVEEFLHRWEELPDLKNAELIDGLRYVDPLVACAICPGHAWMQGGEQQHVADAG